MPAGMVTGLRGVDLGVPDVAAHARFYTEVWRLSVAAERSGSVYLRGAGRMKAAQKKIEFAEGLFRP